MKEELIKMLAEAEKVLIGIGEEWSVEKQPHIEGAYEALYGVMEGKDYFIVTTLTDAKIFDSPLDPLRITAPCGNDTWKQCSKSCTKDIWEAHEVLEGICPHCKEPLVSNTMKAGSYIEEGYLPQWQAYTKWLSGTLNKKLVVLELGEGFGTPTVIRWPFEKTVFFNKQAAMYRIHQTFSQANEELKDKMITISENSCDFFRKFS